MTRSDLIIEKLLNYEKDIVPISREDILIFFEKINAPYRQDHVCFLERFGGCNPLFLKKNRLDATFEEIKDFYNENIIIPDDSCYFCDTALDFLVIKQSDGTIYSFHTKIITKDISGQEVYDHVEFQGIEIEYGNINSVLFHGLILNICIPKFSQGQSFGKFTDKEIEKFIKENKEYSFPDIYINGFIFFIKNNFLYVINNNFKTITTHNLSINL